MRWESPVVRDERSAPLSRTASISRGLLITSIHAYRLVLSPWLGPACRFQPSCSEYAIEAIGRHGVWRGVLLSARRLGRCHPLGGVGYDPVP